MESICKHCGKRIVERSYGWVHQSAGSAFQDNEHRSCKLTVAEPKKAVIDRD